LLIFGGGVIERGVLGVELDGFFRIEGWKASVGLRDPKVKVRQQSFHPKDKRIFGPTVFPRIKAAVISIHISNGFHHANIFNSNSPTQQKTPSDNTLSFHPTRAPFKSIPQNGFLSSDSTRTRHKLITTICDLESI
jgi:hypothetical protein